MNTAWQPLPWHEALWRQLNESIAQNRLGHALLLSGPRGVGKRHLLQGLTGRLLCETPTAEGAACGICRSCQQWAAGHHPNLMRLQPEEGKRDIAIEQVRQLIERLGLSSHYEMRKLAVIDPADALNASGVNALLKTVEEPPRGSHLLLVTERLMSLAATLRSRCQILRLGAPPADMAEAWLAARYPEVPEAQRRPYLRAPLSLADALGEEAQTQRQKWAQWAVDAAQGRLGAALKGVDRTRKEDAEGFLRWMLEEGTATLAAQLRGDPRSSAFATVPPGALQGLLPMAIEGLRRIAGNANPQLLLESLMIQISKTRKEERPR